MEETYAERQKRLNDCYYALQDAPQIRKFKNELKLTEEKRRLLTCIIEWMGIAMIRLGFKSFDLYELHKRVNSAKTMEELAGVGDELAKFKMEHPELEP